MGTQADVLHDEPRHFPKSLHAADGLLVDRTMRRLQRHADHKHLLHELVSWRGRFVYRRSGRVLQPDSFRCGISYSAWTVAGRFAGPDHGIPAQPDHIA